MRRTRPFGIIAVWGLTLVLIAASWCGSAAAAAAEEKRLIYDEAGLLGEESIERLEALALQYGAERETDMIIYTSKNEENEDVLKMTQDFYDEMAPGYDQPHGNAVILTLDMGNREVYLAGFYKAEQYLDDGRLDSIRTKITPYLSNGDYERAFETYLRTAYDYMGFPPGVDPNFFLFNPVFQLVASLVFAGLVVGAMTFRTGGLVTVNKRTYEDAGTSGVKRKQDRYLRTTTTKRKIPKNNGSGGGGGGGITGGGRSHSGSRGSF